MYINLGCALIMVLPITTALYHRARVQVVYCACARPLHRGHRPLSGAGELRHVWPVESLGRCAKRKFNKWYMYICSLLFIYIPCLFAKPIRLNDCQIMRSPLAGASCVTGRRTVNSLSYGAERNFFLHPKNSLVMTAALIAAIVLGIAGIAAGAIGTANANQEQRLHDKQMADYELENQKKLLDYETELQQSNNTIATQKGHAAAAGFSPALLYGSMSTPALSNVNGGSTGASSGRINPLQLFDRMPLSNITETMLTEKQQNMNYEKIQSEVGLNKQRSLESAARTMEQIRDTSVKKRLEQTIIDQATANLNLTEQQSGYYGSMTSRINLLLPGEVEAQGLLNAQTAERTKQIVQDTLRSKADTVRINIDRQRLSALTELINEQKGTPTAEREAIYANIAGMQESIKRSALGRIMSESGLSGLKLPPSMRGSVKDTDPDNFSKSAFYMNHREQINGALSALLSLGFTPDEASMAVIYYVSDARDVSPSVINGLSRVASGMLTKK